MTEEKVGVLLVEAPSKDEIYDFETGRALLMPVIPLNPPPPEREAIKVGIIDSGVIAQHPQLRGLVIVEKAFVGTDPVDRIGHGTAVALQFLRGYYVKDLLDLMGGKLSSPALISANVVGLDGAPRLNAVIDAIHWVVAQGAQVVNLSLGFRGSAEEYKDLCHTIASYSEVSFCAAEGNYGPNVHVYPAACGLSNLISVGEVHKGVPTPTSGPGQVYAEGTVVLIPPWAYYLDSGKQAARGGDLSAARQYLERSLTEEENPEALIQLALLDLHEKKEVLEKAYHLLERAAQLAPDLGPIYTHLGAIRMIQNRYPEAEAHLNKALTLDPHDQLALFNLGQTLLELKRHLEALSAFEKVRALNPNYPRIEAAIAYAQEESNKASPSKEEK